MMNKLTHDLTIITQVGAREIVLQFDMIYNPLLVTIIPSKPRSGVFWVQGAFGCYRKAVTHPAEFVGVSV